MQIIDTGIVKLYVEMGLSKNPQLEAFLADPNEAQLSLLENFLISNKVGEFAGVAV